ncbi:MAG TPA: hypothetical protein VLE47_03200 [Candidatus Saccharimonadales bacterium]|nr:hypothetical protein [Candidatus Saccharimonadales bacterium]
MSQNNSEVTGWAGWAAFAGFLMILVGSFQALSGLTAIFKKEFFVVAPQNLLVFDITTWGWVHLALGALIIFAGVAVLNGKVWGRFIGVVIAMTSALANMAFLNVYPFWSILIIVVDILVIYALIVHGHELREE